MSGIKIANDMKNTFDRAGFTTLSVFVYGSVVLIKFIPSEMDNAKKCGSMLEKAGFIKVTIEEMPNGNYCLGAEIAA